MNTEEAQEFRDALNNLSATELRGMLGSGDEEDVMINELLGAGKAVEVAGGASADEAADEADDGDEPDDTDAGDDADEGEAEAVAAAVADPAVAAASEPVTAEPVTTAAEEAAPAPLDLAFLDAEFKQRQQQLDADKRAKFKDMMEGVIDADEYSDFEAQYLDQRDALQQEKREHAEWYRTIHGFKAQARADGVDYDADPAKSQAWDDWVKRLAASQPGKPDNWYLEQAHKKVLIEFELSPTRAAPAAARGPKPGARAPRLDNLPPTLANLPAASAAQASDEGEFAHIDRLSGMEFERALARMTPEQAARYEAS